MFKSTTVITVRRNGKAAMAGDGQVTLGETVMKSNARKVRKIYSDKVLTGFAGSAADGLTLLEKFEEKINEYAGDLARSSVELAKEWRSDKYLRRLEAILVVADDKKTFLISGNGDVIEPEEGIAAIGSGGPYALSAARALFRCTELSAKEIVNISLEIAGNICIYTNTNIIVEEL